MTTYYIVFFREKYMPFPKQDIFRPAGMFHDMEDVQEMCERISNYGNLEWKIIELK